MEVNHPQIGQKIPNLPEQYLTEKGNKPPGLACLMMTESCPENYAILIKDSVIVSVLELTGPFIVPDPGLYDGIIMNPNSIADGSVEHAAAQAKKYYS